MGNTPENEKALRYIAQLDEARCSGRWQDIPELCRKIEKHAPHRRCLTLTARSEAQIHAHSSQRPSTAASTSSAGLSNIIPSLLSAIEEEDHAQDSFQATVCLGWLHYVLNEPGLAVARLPKDFALTASQMKNIGPLSGWTRVCIVKGAFLKGSSQDRTGLIDEAIETYRSVIPWLSSLTSISNESSLFKSWIERLLVRLCQLSDLSVKRGEPVDAEDALYAYRYWAKYWESTGKGVTGVDMAPHRRSAWKAYYDSLSEILRHNLPYHPENTTQNATTATEPEEKSIQPREKLQQRAELKRVEAVYESLLLKETHFPKASENNSEIEAWTDSVMNNWLYMCGPTWSDSDLGEGGKEAVGRGVLDILYRAATKTFHSTQVLRHLFTVHASLAEFDLAFKAYDSYVEIITRGKDRTEKSGEVDAGLDDDSTVLRTSAEAIRVLCRFGSRKEAAKAVEIGAQIEHWLEQIQNIRPSGPETGPVRSIETLVLPKALSIAYSAIGISQAHWAHHTYEADARRAIQSKAVQYLRKSVEPKFEDPHNIEALYALTLVLAEMRDVPGAIKVAKRALSSATKNDSTLSADGVLSNGLKTEYGRERKLIPMWHLLALLLTARSEYTAAEKACEAAFEQFGDPALLFGSEDDNASYRSEHLNELSGKNTQSSPQGIVDQMTSFEKTGILQIKMTQLALVEVVEGAGAAVDGCDELLALYARLFGDPTADQAQLQPPPTSVAPPKSAVGTIRNSIFRTRGSIRNSYPDKSTRDSSATTLRPPTAAGQPAAAPAIQVTDESGADHAKHHVHLPHLPRHRHEDEKSGVTRTPSKLKKRSANSLRRKADSEAGTASDVPGLPDAANGSAFRNSIGSRGRRSSNASSLRKSVDGHDRQLRSVAHNLPNSSEPPPVGHAKQPPKQDARLPVPFPGADYIPPSPRFSKLQSRRHRVTLLVDIWIFISDLYLKADMLEDSKGAVNEAFKLVESFEAEVAQEGSSSKAFADRGWGGGKSVEELWADSFAARGQLLLAQSLKHEARSEFERAVMHYPDHPQAIVGLSNILLDIYCQAVPLEPTQVSEELAISSSPSTSPATETTPSTQQQRLSSHTPSAENQISPPELNRLAARDRAFGLLSTLTKLGTGWDYSEAWYTLARAYEESNQLDKTKEVLWWCVELEDTHPVRSWKNVTLGGLVL
ncbi:hypothetical protein BU24DRAFT_374080 [Aaosphaeria arxii CBS 175.79]|uniref:Filamentation protein-like protein n=1 Tax=Aaosphaeria arxii CBS 175.79 TaxID=1450172 RepID=A0A6A5XJN4_9PLEO|nr:uncharacterized protein BU24DRAFT_374080 [Aaosphaeria arxii CBS 175.79]KAF2012514.1 hypothetical protein BU24DRAFT_374080 [Aaosphaeria arxii CBS 175.79]